MSYLSAFNIFYDLFNKIVIKLTQFFFVRLYKIESSTQPFQTIHC